MEKLSKSLTREKNLLESLLPHHAAEGIRAGKQVEPRLHQNLTVFFSGVVGFTNICRQIYPWDVIGMLNRL
jgi:class 3 adenylate cyclase